MSLKLSVRLTPKASKDAVEGWAEDEQGRPYLKVRVRAAPIEGAANAALEALLAKTLGLAKSAVQVDKGTTSRLKQVRIHAPWSEAELRARLGLLKIKS
ncbi:MAG: DUF167 family protein [Asticcacaulis sp.]